VAIKTCERYDNPALPRLQGAARRANRSGLQVSAGWARRSDQSIDGND
jgi:hypothetical protein